MPIFPSEKKSPIREAIIRMSPYNPPLENRNPEEHILMDFNEAPLPPQKQVIEKITEFLSTRTHAYPSYGDLLDCLGEYCGVSPNSLMLTNGSDQGIDVVLRSLLEAGDEVVMVKPGFAMFEQVAGTLGCKVVGPEFPANLSFPVEDLKASVNEKTRLIVVINPNNPTGTSVALQQIEDLLQTFPDIPILVDEAYYEFTDLTCVPLMRQYENLIVIRTFSKALAMPSLRLGYVVASPEWIGHLHKIRGPYDVNMVAVLVAREQLRHSEHWKSVVQHIMEKSKPAIESYFKENKVNYYPGAANFLLVEPKNVTKAVEYLKENKILVRPMRAPIAHMFRMSLRMLPEMEKFMSIYSKYLEIELKT